MADTSALVGYAVMNMPEELASSSALVGYAVMNYPEGVAGSASLVGYAVMTAKPKVGQILGYEGDAWMNDPTSFEVQWQRDGVDIVGATGATYQLAAADAGTLVRARLIAVNAGGKSEAVFSSPVGPVDP